MINSIDLSRISFHGFSLSKNWIGYFQWIGFDDETKTSEYSEELTHKAGLLVYEYFKDNWNDFFLLSAVSYCDEIEGDPELTQQLNDPIIDKFYGNTYREAKKRDLFIPQNIGYGEWLDNHDAELPAKFIKLCFDTDFILPFSEMVMGMVFGKVVGQQCFLINPKLQIALYPHEDIGYGCIDLGDNPKILTDFLNYCDKSKDFVSHIEEQYR